jgi:cyclophilin family peptidyl-prolyl cis-trans isomerase
MGTAKRERQKQGRQARIAQAQAAAAKRKRMRSGVLLAVLVVALVGLALFVGAGGDDDEDVTAAASSTTLDPTLESSTTTTGVPTPCPAPDGTSPRTLDFTAPMAMCIDPAKSYTAVFDTTAGEIRVALDTATTPIATNNFVALARYHYYDATEIFRLATSIGIIQGGSPHTQDNADAGPGYTIEDEGFDDDVVFAGQGGPFSYVPGDLVYARPEGQPDSSSAQFFFCVTDACSNLDSQGIYVKFGRTTQGLDILEAILALAPPREGPPTTPVTVNSVTIEEA